MLDRSVETDLKPSSIEMDCGFGSISTFHDMFETRTGASPIALRRDEGREGVGGAPAVGTGPTGWVSRPPSR